MRVPSRARARARAPLARVLHLRRALVLPLLLLSACGMLDARLEARTACFTLPEYAIPGATGTGELSAPLALDLGEALPFLSEPGVRYRLRLRDVTLGLESSAAVADLGGLDVFAVSAIAPAGSALPEPELVRYERPPGADPRPASVTAPATSDVDLAPYVDAGLLRLGASARGALPSSPWRATVTACFLLEVDVEYGEQL